MMNRSIFLFLIFFIIISCTTQKELTLFNNIEKDEVPLLFTNQAPHYRIQKGDILYVRIFSPNQEIDDWMNITSSQYTQSLFMNEANIYINGFIVNDSGNIQLPVVGKINILDMTIEEARITVERETLKYIKDGTVIVKLLSYQYTVLGEVYRPGAYRNYQDQLTIMEALGTAGGINDYGSRKKVMLLRHQNDTIMGSYIDLTKKEMISTQEYFILPDDVLYVPPVKKKTFQINASTYAVLLSTVTTAILVLNYINKP